MLDVSAAGAKLVAEVDAIVGTSFKLSIVPRSIVRKECEVVWRTGRVIGVKFVDNTREPQPG